jgi:pyruvate/2-oxoglutarate dehydrogenase complex dihydrolipoamide dehydrogenase (E3) component
VPSKTLIKAAKVQQFARDRERYGLPPVDVPAADLGKVMKHVHDVIDRIAVHDSPERFRSLGAEVIFGEPELVSPHEVRVDGKILSARTIVLATGSSPFVPPIPGLAETGYITNVDVFSLTDMPDHLITIGAGPIGVELSQSFLRLGAKVTLFDAAPRILPREDEDVSELMKQRLEAEGAQVFAGCKIEKVSTTSPNRKKVEFVDSQGKRTTVEGDEILAAIGRMGNGDSLNPANAGLETTRGFFSVEADLTTNQKSIMAVGDANGTHLFTHVAGSEGSLAVRKIVFRLPIKMHYENVPWVTYTDPEIASVGYNETRAGEAGIDYTIVESEYGETDRAQAEAEPEGKIKILLDGKGRVIGTQIVGIHAGELLIPSILAVNNKFKLMNLYAPIFPYPTLSETYKKAAAGYFSPKIFNRRVRRVLKTVFGYRGRTD